MTKIQRRIFDVNIDLDKISGHEGKLVAELLRYVAESMELSDHINSITNNLYGYEDQHVGTVTCRTTEIIT